MSQHPLRSLVAVLLFLTCALVASPAAAAEGQLTWAVHITLAPTWFDPDAVGPRVEESGLGLIAGHAYSAPYEDLKLKAR